MLALAEDEVEGVVFFEGGAGRDGDESWVLGVSSDFLGLGEVGKGGGGLLIPLSLQVS